MLHSKLPLKKSKYWEQTKRSWGVYKFVQNGRVIYIGSSCDSFEKRALAHQIHQHNYALAEALKEGNVVMEPIIVFDDTDRFFFTKYDVLELEAKLIRTLKPKFNHQFKDLDFEDQLANDIRMGRYTAQEVESWKATAPKH